MYWILIERELAKAEFITAMKILFPNLSFSYYDVEHQENNDLKALFLRDGKHITYSITKWSERIKTKLEVYDFPNAGSIERTQYIGKFLSNYFSTKVVTEFNASHTHILQHYSLLIGDSNLKIIDDDGIEFDNYEYKILTDFTGTIPVFDEKGCL
jgi:hypothetical protein